MILFKTWFIMYLQVKELAPEAKPKNATGNKKDMPAYMAEWGIAWSG